MADTFIFKPTNDTPPDDDTRYEHKLTNAYIKSWSTSGDADSRPTDAGGFDFSGLGIGDSDWDALF